MYFLKDTGCCMFPIKDFERISTTKKIQNVRLIFFVEIAGMLTMEKKRGLITRRA